MSQTKSRVTLYAMVMIACVFIDLMWPGRSGLALSAASFLVWSVWLVNSEMKAAVLKLNPIVCYQCWQLATLGLVPLYISQGSEYESGMYFGNYLIPPGNVAYGHAILVAGSCAFYAGMRQFQPREPQVEPASGWGANGLSLLFVGAIGVAVHVGSEVLNANLGSSVVQLATLPLAALCMVALNPPRTLWHSTTAQLGILLAGSICVFLLNARRDSKLDLICSFVPLIWWALYRNKRGLLVTLGIGLPALYLGLIAPLVSNVRNIGARDEKGLIGILGSGSGEQAINSMSESYSSGVAGHLETWSEQTVLRMCDPCAAGIVAIFAHDKGSLEGRGLVYVPMSFVPRIVWPDKPHLDPGRDFTAALGWASEASQATTTTGQTCAGELYWNFGWLGVFIGMYLFGAAISGIWWGAAGRDPRDGILELTAYTGAMLSFVAGTGAAAGTGIVITLSTGLLLRAAIALRDRVTNKRVR